VLGSGHGLAANVADQLKYVDPRPGGVASILSTTAGGASRAALKLGHGDAWLAKVFPDARRVVAMTLTEDPVSWLVMELPGRGARIERRVVGTAAHACSAAALAASRTALLEKLRSAASTDGLTGVANRRTFDETMARLRRSGDMPASIILVDVDHFKQVNDRHGHQVGDEVLQRVAALLARQSRTTDLVARYGGEEFVVLLPRTSEQDAVAVAEGMRMAIGNGEGPVPVTASFGVSTGFALQDVDELVARSDQCLYHAKRTGRNRVVPFTALSALSTEAPAA
jgi:diguanylate cyclase (GGDEF)-like protein